MGLGLVGSNFPPLRCCAQWLGAQEQSGRHLARCYYWCSSSQGRWVLVARRHGMLRRVGLKVPLRDEVTRQARIGEPCCFAIGVRRPALLQPKADGLLSLLTSAPTALLRDEVTRPAKIFGRDFSAFCAPRPELRPPMADGGLHLRR